MDSSATIGTYPMKEKYSGQENEQEQDTQKAFTISVAPPQCDATVHQPQRDIQQQSLRHTCVHIQQPGRALLMSEISEGRQSNIDICGYFFLSFCSFLFCWPIGISAVIVSFLFCHSKREGNFEEAKTYARLTAGLSIVAIVCGCAFIVIVVTRVY